MWNDNDTHIDLIDFTHLVDTSISIIDNKDLIPCTIGFYGDWGSGKSSLIRMVEERYKEKENTLTIKFNGWLFEGYDDAKSVLMRTILEQIIKQKTISSKAKEIAKRLYKQIDWMKVAKSAVSHGASYLLTGGIGNIALGFRDMLNTDASKIKDTITEQADKFSDGEYDKLIEGITKSEDTNKTFQAGIREFHKDFEELLSETKISQLIVFIDDLDRCTPDTVISTLEAIKLFLFVPKSTFVICADERLIKYAVRKRFPEIQGANAEVGRDYLEKLIQYPIRIPAMDNLEMETYINLLFCKLSVTSDQFENIRNQVMINKRKELFSSVINSGTISKFMKDSPVPEKLKEDLMLSSQITSLLTAGLNGNPRQCKRFLNMLLLRLKMAESKGVAIQKQILAKLMLLEYFKPETFRTLSAIQAKQEGCPIEIKYGEALIKDKAAKAIDDSKLDMKSLITEEWFKRWFEIDPQLSDVDLRPYFYFSRDVLGVITVDTSRMSSQAQEVYQKLVNESKAIVKNGMRDFKNLSVADSASIFTSFCSKIRTEGNGSKIGTYLKTLIQISESKTELLSELIIFLDSTPVNTITPAVIPSLLKVTKETSNDNAAKNLISKWSKSENKGLAKIAEQNL